MLGDMVCRESARKSTTDLINRFARVAASGILPLALFNLLLDNVGTIRRQTAFAE
jgi:hypothetical protein